LPPVPYSGPVPPSQIVLSVSHRVVVRHAAVRMTMSCLGLVACSGHARLRGKSMRRTVGSVGFTVGQGRRATLRLALNRTSRHLLRRHRHGLTAQLTVLSGSHGRHLGRRVTLRLPG
jgi:hypothetical protein